MLDPFRDHTKSLKEKERLWGEMGPLYTELVLNTSHIRLWPKPWG